MLDKCFEFDLHWNDVDVFQVRISGCNGRFAGTADAYVPIGGLAEAAAKLNGFPQKAGDERELQFGTFGAECAGGALKMRFYAEGCGVRTFVEAWFESEHDHSGKSETVHFHASVEASAVDQFVSELGRLEKSKSGTARMSIGTR